MLRILPHRVIPSVAVISAVVMIMHGGVRCGRRFSDQGVAEAGSHVDHLPAGLFICTAKACAIFTATANVSA